MCRHMKEASTGYKVVLFNQAQDVLTTPLTQYHNSQIQSVIGQPWISQVVPDMVYRHHS